MRLRARSSPVSLALVALFGASCRGADGTSCTVTPSADGESAVIACTDGSTFTVENGADGSTGTPGTDGSDCTVTDNGDGTKTIACEDGTSVTVMDGTDGRSCTVTDNHDATYTIACDDGTSLTLSSVPSSTAGSVTVDHLHGQDALEEQLLEDGMYRANPTITAATADTAGKLTVTFELKNADGTPIDNLTGASVTANVAKLVPATSADAANHWEPYIWRVQTVSGSANGDWPNPDGTRATQGYRENNGVLTHVGSGTYTYEYATNLTAAVRDTTPIAYDRTLTHRVVIMLGGTDGPLGAGAFDFVPDGSAVTETREVVETATCQQCHGPSFSAHGESGRVTVEACTSCHVPGASDPQGGESLDMKTMVHRIHAGSDLPSSPGADGEVFDDPATTIDESADNGKLGTDGVIRPYSIWGYQNHRYSWETASFPANIANCTKCHTGPPSDVDNWKVAPSRDACGSCHEDVDFATGVNHGGNAQSDDSNCNVCHTPSGNTLVESIPLAHDFTDDDSRIVSEFIANLTVSTPANGQYFVAGEAPVVTIVLENRATGVAIDHTTVTEDSAAEGCWTSYPPSSFASACDPSDGRFRVASLFVDGPRDRRMPVLTTAARAQALSSSTGPFDLSAAGATLALKVDGGLDMILRDANGSDFVSSGTITVSVVSSAFASPAAATPAEIAAWLNNDAKFKARAIAAVEPSGKLSVRSRGLGKVRATQLLTSVVTTNVFANDTAVKQPTGSTPGNNVSARTNAANNDPKAVRTAGSITYQLDPVDDLAPGTYVTSLEFADRGRLDDNNYVTPTVAVTTFQVKTATVELPPAGNCDSCHQNAAGQGLVFDPARHQKILNDSAVDQCGACHDYQPQSATGLSWTGAAPISRRVHAVHSGALLNYPVTTVAHADEPVGRMWDITFPQDLRNCEVCHPTGATSGSWAMQPDRLACGGCHDGDADTAHMRLQTLDPTPSDPWSGDEVETCTTCHAP